MPEKLMTLQELSEYLLISEEKLASLVNERYIPAYRIGGELLRFRKDQIDAMRSEIESKISDTDKIIVSEARRTVKERFKTEDSGEYDSFNDKLHDFLYFNDFYIVSGILAVILLIVIFRG